MSFVEKIMVKARDASGTRILLGGYCLLITLGTFLLSLPEALQPGVESSFLTSFFTATSAACVTGLVVVDTATHWSLFGQGVILGLIQIGGLGFMTVCITIISMTHLKIGMSGRILMQNSLSAPHIGGIVRMTRFVFAGTLLAEALGALFLSLRFVPSLGLGDGLWYSVFHSISAFCNAGFDLMGSYGPFQSLVPFSGDLLVNSVIASLIIIGGLGFPIWGDLFRCKFRFSHLTLHSKLAISTSLGLLILGFLLIYILEKDGLAMSAMTTGQKVLAAGFQSVTVRTAGFATLDLATLSQPAIFLMSLLMLVGGSPGSTAGGIKTTTFAVLLLSISSTFRNRKNAEIFGRRLEDGLTRTATCVLMCYLLLSCGVAIYISHVDQVELYLAFFESVSAIATVGLSAGLTPTLSTGSLLLLTALMVFGRAGSLTILGAFLSEKRHPSSLVPQEKIQIG